MKTRVHERWFSTPLTVRIAAMVLGLLVGAAAVAAVPNKAAQRLRGIDTSHHNGRIDWAKVKAAGIDFAFVKVTQGVDYLDPDFAEHFAAAKKAGVIRGAYHFYQTNDDGVKQADWFIQNAPLTSGDLPPVVDIEKIKAPLYEDLHHQFEKFLDRLEAHYGRRPIIYTGPTFWEHAMKDHLPGNRLWIAEYGVETPTIPVEWASWSFWQYTDAMKVSGVDKPIDGSVFNGDAGAFQALLLP